MSLRDRRMADLITGVENMAADVAKDMEYFASLDVDRAEALAAACVWLDEIAQSLEQVREDVSLHGKDEG